MGPADARIVNAGSSRTWAATVEVPICGELSHAYAWVARRCERFHNVWRRRFDRPRLIVGVADAGRTGAIQAGILLLGLAGLATDRPATHRLILILAGGVAAIAMAVLLRPGSIAA